MNQATRYLYQRVGKEIHQHVSIILLAQMHRIPNMCKLTNYPHPNILYVDVLKALFTFIPKFTNVKRVKCK